MKKFDLGQTISILANIGVVLGILFLAIEIRQNDATARLNGFAILSSSGNAARNAIIEHAGVWERGVQGLELSEGDQTRFENLVLNLNDSAITVWASELELGNTIDAELTLYDFAAFLHQNPGARKIWEAREEILHRYRRILSPENWDYWKDWPDEVSEALVLIDEAAE